jgi:hypothetical protein
MYSYLERIKKRKITNNKVPIAMATIKFLVSLASFSLRGARGLADALAATLADAFGNDFFFAMMFFNL